MVSFALVDNRELYKLNIKYCSTFYKSKQRRFRFKIFGSQFEKSVLINTF